MIDYLKLYNEKIEAEAEEQLLESLEKLDEAAIMLAIGAALAAGALFRIIDGIRGNKPKLRHYIKGIITWAFSEYENGSLSINEIRKAAYATMEEDEEIRAPFGPSSSKILSKQLLKGLKKGSREFSRILGEAIGRIATRANMSKSDLDKTIKTVDL